VIDANRYRDDSHSRVVAAISPTTSASVRPEDFST
jgi:hypothetical protein